LEREPNNQHDSKAVAAYHGSTKIGYIPAEKRWVCNSIDEGDTHEVHVSGFVEDEEGVLVALEIEVGVVDPPAVPYEPSVQRLTLDALKGELLILASVAKSDGRLARIERDIILRYAEERAIDKGLTFNSEISVYIDNWLRRQDPDYFSALKQLPGLAVDDRSAAEALLEVLPIVAEIDGKLLEAEVDRVSKLQDLIRHLLSQGHLGRK